MLIERNETAGLIVSAWAAGLIVQARAASIWLLKRAQENYQEMKQLCKAPAKSFDFKVQS